MIALGITGGIASGKSTVTRMLAERGAQTFSADQDARAVLHDPAILDAVRAAFPDAGTPDGGIDRAALGRIVFADPAERRHLESLLHPAIIERMRGAIATARDAAAPVAPLLAYEVPLLYEANLEHLFDYVVAVVVSPEIQAERLQAREQAAGRPVLTAEAIAERLSAQLPLEEKARRADFVIRTDTSLEDTRAQVAALWERLTGGNAPGRL